MLYFIWSYTILFLVGQHVYRKCFFFWEKQRQNSATFILICKTRSIHKSQKINTKCKPTVKEMAIRKQEQRLAPQLLWEGRYLLPKFLSNFSQNMTYFGNPRKHSLYTPHEWFPPDSSCPLVFCVIPIMPSPDFLLLYVWMIGGLTLF